MSSKPNPGYFRPPPETYAYFKGLVEEDDDLEDQTEQGRTQVELSAPTIDNNEDDEIAVFLNGSKRPPRKSLIQKSPVVDVTERKRREQEERFMTVEEEIVAYLEEFPQDTKIRARLLHLQSYKNRLERSRTQILNPSEFKFLYETGRIIERRRVANEAKAFEKLAEAMVANEDVPLRDKDNEKKKRRPITNGSQSSITLSQIPRNFKRQRLDEATEGYEDAGEGVEGTRRESDDKEEGEGEGEERRSYGGKTVGENFSTDVENFDVNSMLEGPLENDSQDDSEDANDREESSDSETGSSSGTDDITR